MRLSSVDGSGFELRIAGYEFPDLLTKGYEYPKFRELAEGSKLELQIEDDGLPNPLAAFDANWLVIEGVVQHQQGDWTFRDPCLLADEVARLADWLEAAASGIEKESSCGFIEPNLFFDLVGVEGKRRLRVSFSAEARPAWAKPGEEVSVDFPLAGLDLASAVAALREQIRQYPQRAEYC